MNFPIEYFTNLEQKAYNELKTYDRPTYYDYHLDGTCYTKEVKDLFARANMFMAMFSFDNVLEMKDVPVSEQDIIELNDFVTSCRWRFCQDADFVVRSGKRVFGAMDDNDLQNAGCPRGTINVMKKWIMLGCGNTTALTRSESELPFGTEGNPIYDKYVLWFVEQMIPRGRFEGNFDTYEYILAYACRYGTPTLCYALFHALYNCGRQGVVDLINDNIGTILMFVLNSQNTPIFYLIEKKYAHVLPNKQIDYDHALVLYCMNKADVDYGLTEHLVSRMKNPCYPINPIELIYGEQWYRLRLLRNMLIKYGKWNITNNVINNVMYNIKENDINYTQNLAVIFGHSLINGRPPNDDVVVMTPT